MYNLSESHFSGRLKVVTYEPTGDPLSNNPFINGGFFSNGYLMLV